MAKMDDMNLQERTLSNSDDLVIKAARFGSLGWLAFFLLLIVFVAQNVIWQLKAKEVWAAENGVIVGQVVFDETKSRSNDRVIGDLKEWVAACTTVNKIKVWEDLAICLGHMSADLADIKILEYEKTSYAANIEAYGCDRTTINFDHKKIDFKREPLTEWINARMVGTVVCEDGSNKPPSQDFDMQIKAQLVRRTTSNTLAIKVTEYRDI